MSSTQTQNQTQVQTQVQTPVKTRLQESVQTPVQVPKKTIFSDEPKKAEETPEWMKEASENATDKIAGAGSSENKIEEQVAQASSNDFVDTLPKFKAEKPSSTELGKDPSSMITVTPSLEVVKKASEEAAKKLDEQGIDPNTGKVSEKKISELKKKVEEVKGKSAEKKAGQVKVEEVKGKSAKIEEEKVEQKEASKASAIAVEKKSLFDNIKSLFVSAAKKRQDAVDKVDSIEGGVKITAAEKKEYIDAEKIYQDGLAKIKDLIAPGAMEINYDTVRIDGIFARSFYVYAYPRYLDVNWLAPIVNFDVTMDICQYIYPIDSAKIMRVLKKKVAQMESSVRIDAEKGKVRDPALETALEDAESLRTDIQRGQEKFFQFALYFTLYAEDEKKLDRISKQLESLLAGKLVMTKRAQLQSEHGLNACLPLCLDELNVIRNMNTSPLSTTFPFTSSDLTSDKGILYGINRHNDSLIIFDRFALENANSVVLAKSGAGKSYAVKLEVLRLMMMGTDVIVVDPENEYESLSNMVGGTYLRLSLNSDRRINPFDLPKPIEGEEVSAGDLLRSNIINLHGLLKLMLGGVTPEEESVLDKALIDVYALKGITMDLVDPSIYAPPTMEDLYQILNSMTGATSLVQKLSKYTTGSYSGIFNKPTNVDMANGMMVFCIRDLEDALRPIAMYIILNHIWAKVRSQLKKRVLVVDEAWTMMQHEDSAKFLFGLVKRARKYYLGVTTITQDVEDFIKSDLGKPIITNSSMQLLLKQAPSSVDVLAQIFNLTEGEKYVLLNSGVGQGLFFAGMKHVAVQVVASFTEDKIVTTNPEEILQAKEEAVANLGKKA